MFQCVIFDLDGTLLNTLTDLANACNHTLQSMKLPTHPIEAYKKMVGNGIPHLVYKMLPEHSNGKGSQSIALALFENYYRQHMLDATAPYSGILPLLDLLKSHAIKLAVASNKDDLYTQQIVSRFFPNTFDYVQGLKPGFPAKPSPEIVHSILLQLKADHSDCLFCGDSDVDMLTANAAAVKACGVLWGFRSKAELLAAGADHLADTPNALEQLILT